MKYDIIVFDVDGTLLDTRQTILLSLQHMLQQVTERVYPFEQLNFALGIPGEDALEQLGIVDQKQAMEIWWDYSGRYGYLTKVFAGIEDITKYLKQQGCQLGIVTSRTRDEFAEVRQMYSFVKRFDVVVCADDTQKHKPEAEPMFKLLELAKVNKSRALYIGDAVYDMECARKAGVEGALALWGCHQKEGILAEYYLEKPEDIKSLLNS